MDGSRTDVAWTKADQAEGDQLAWELVDTYFRHRETCQPCQNGDGKHLRAAIEELLAWKRTRLLRTAAAVLRADQDLFEIERERARNKQRAA